MPMQDGAYFHRVREFWHGDFYWHETVIPIIGLRVVCG